MKSTLQQSAAALLAQLEAYLGKIARALAPSKNLDLLAYLTPILRDISPRSKLLRQAFGFPVSVGFSRNLAGIMLSNEPSSRPIISVFAQRMNQFLWRAEYTFRGIDASWQDEALKKISSISQLCEPYLLTQRPTLLELISVLDLKSDLKRFSESAADPVLFAVLRAFDYEEAQLPIAEADKKAMKEKALTFIYEYLVGISERHRAMDDSSNAWWAIRLGLENDDARFGPLVDKFLDLFPKPRVPETEVRSLSLVPDIYTELRTSAYTLVSVEAMLENGSLLDADVRSRLKALIGSVVQRLLKESPSANLYLACVHYEGLRSYLDYVEHEYIASKLNGSRLSLSKFQPVGQFVCADSSLENDIRSLLTWLRSSAAHKNRASILVYGASSTGKSFLVKQLFSAFGQKDVYEDRQVVCSPSLDFIAVLKGKLGVIASAPGTSDPPFLFIDEADVEFSTSIFPTLLTLLDKGEIGGAGVNIEELVIFWAGGKHGSIRAFKTFLEKKQKSKPFEKGVDMFNRAKQRLDLPASLVSNRNQKLLLGLAAITRQFGSPVTVDYGIVRYLRSMPMSDKQGVREFEIFSSRLNRENGVVFLPDEQRRGREITVES